MERASSPPITTIGKRCPMPKRRENLLGIGARRVGDHRALQSAPVGEIEQRKRAEDRFELAQAVAIGRLLGVEGRRLLNRRQVRKAATARSSRWTRP